MTTNDLIGFVHVVVFALLTSLHASVCEISKCLWRVNAHEQYLYSFPNPLRLVLSFFLVNCSHTLDLAFQRTDCANPWAAMRLRKSKAVLKKKRWMSRRSIVVFPPGFTPYRYNQEYIRTRVGNSRSFCYECCHGRIRSSSSLPTSVCTKKGKTFILERWAQRWTLYFDEHVHSWCTRHMRTPRPQAQVGRVYLAPPPDNPTIRPVATGVWLE